MVSELLGVRYTHVYIFLCVRSGVCITPPPICPVAMQVTLNNLTHTGLCHATVFLTLSNYYALLPSHLLPLPFSGLSYYSEIFRIFVHTVLPTTNTQPVTHLPASDIPDKFKLLFAPCSLTLAPSVSLGVNSSVSIERLSSLGSCL